MKLIDNINLDLEVIKQGLCFNAWDMGEEEPSNKNKNNNIYISKDGVQTPSVPTLTPKTIDLQGKYIKTNCQKPKNRVAVAQTTNKEKNDREMSKIILICRNPNERGQRMELKFSKKLGKSDKNSVFETHHYQDLHTNGNVGNDMSILRNKPKSIINKGVENITNITNITKPTKLGKYQFTTKEGKVISMKPTNCPDKIADILFDEYDKDESVMQGKAKIEND